MIYFVRVKTLSIRKYKAKQYKQVNIQWMQKYYKVSYKNTK